MNKLTIRCRNNGRKISVPFGSTLHDVFGQAGMVLPYGPVCARVNN